MKDNSKKSLETAVFGGGCFWCLEAVFRQLEGVHNVVSGYAGGHSANPTYNEVSTGRTGHAEVVQVHYDRAIVSFQNLLEVFFSVHDPTTLNRQGADVGSQYRSIILCQDEPQLKQSKQIVAQLEDENLFPAPIITELVMLDKFFVAEDHHQNYLAKNPDQAYCQLVIAPKLAKFQKHFNSKFSKSG